MENPDAPDELTFDFALWSTRFSLAEYRDTVMQMYGTGGLFNVGGMMVSTPRDVILTEQLREEIRQRYEIGRSVPTDVFVFGVGESTRRDLTKIGGLPYRPADKPWPCMPSGAPLTFVGQMRFTESKDILGDLPGDVLLMFARDETVCPTDDPPSVAFEWYPLGIKDLVTPEQVRPPAWTFVTCYGVRFRTSDYPEPQADEAAEHYLAKNAVWWSVFRYEGTKIGGVPYWIQCDEPLAESDYPGRFLGTLGSVSPSYDCEFPWLNQREQISLRDCIKPENSFQWGDSGMAYLFVDDSGTVRWQLQYY